MVNTPVLFETFVRVDYARQVWDAIKAAQPKKLYFYSNKGRIEKECEIARNNEIRSWVNEIDWDCDVHTWFREECVDVYTSLRGAISWLFDNEEMGIILEDDCVPTPAFFSFCDQLLPQYKENNRIWCISGDNFLNVNPSGYDLIYSRHHWMYGWATWRDRWNRIPWDNYRLDEVIHTHLYYKIFGTRAEARLKESDVEKLKNFLPQTNCWDYAFGQAIDQSDGLTIYPKEHLITNIGLSGTHHGQAVKTIYNRESTCHSELYMINKYPPFIVPDYDYDYLIYKYLWKKKSILERLVNKIKRLW